MTVDFELDGRPLTARNGGPEFTYSEAISLQVGCRSQDEADHFWGEFGRDGDAAAQQCGWLKDRYGVSWQIIPTEMQELLQDPDSARSQRVFQAMLQMKKLDIAALRAAADG